MKNIREEILNGDIVTGACCDISDPSVVEALGFAGWDFVLINAEGGTLSPYGGELENMIRAAYRADIAPAVKVPENDPSMIASALKMGAKLIEVPMVSNRKDAKRALQATHYPPKGERMTFWGVPDTRYGADSWADHVQQASEETGVYVVLEDQQAMNNMNEILSTPGLEMVILGELDLALRLGGVEDEQARERVEEYRQEMYRVADKENASVIDIVTSEDEARKAVEYGADGLLYGQDDLGMLRKMSRNRLETLRSGTERRLAE